MSRIIQLRRDAASSWTAVNPILTQGEFGYETDTSKFKIGNGVDDWNTLGYLFQGEEGTTISYYDLSDLPTLFDGAYGSLTGVPSFATVATSGNYSDINGTPSLATVATSGSYTDLSNTPSLSTVAISGSYTDLSNTPTIPSALTDIGISDGANGQVLTTDGTGGFTFQDVPSDTFTSTASGDISAGDPLVVNNGGSVSSAGVSLTDSVRNNMDLPLGASATDIQNTTTQGFIVPIPNTTTAILGSTISMNTANGGNDVPTVVTHLVNVASNGMPTKLSPEYVTEAVNDSAPLTHYIVADSESVKPFLAYWDTSNNCLVFGYIRKQGSDNNGSTNHFYLNSATVSGNNLNWGTSQRMDVVNTDLIRPELTGGRGSYFEIAATAYNSTNNNAAVFFEHEKDSLGTTATVNHEVTPYIISYDGSSFTAAPGDTIKFSDVSGEPYDQGHKNVAAAWCEWDNNYVVSWNNRVNIDSSTVYQKSKVKVASMTATGQVNNVILHYEESYDSNNSGGSYDDLHRELIADNTANRVLYGYAVKVGTGSSDVTERHYKMLTISSGVVTIPSTDSHVVSQEHGNGLMQYRTVMVSSGLYTILKMVRVAPGQYDTYQGYIHWYNYDLLYNGSTFSTRTPANGELQIAQFNHLSASIFGQSIYAAALVNGAVTYSRAVTGTDRIGQNSLTTYKPGEMIQNLTEENFVGFSDSNYSSSSTVTIQTSGNINESQSGLTTGQAYYVQIDGTLSTTPDSIKVFAGVAVSPTSILVAKDSVTSGGVSSYNDLTDLPTLFDGAYSSLSGTPTLFDGAYSSLSGTPTLATVATSGSYTDLTSTPTIPSALTDIGISDGADGQVLTTDGSGNFTFQTVSSGSSGANTLNELTDVSTSGVTNGQILKYNGSSWAPAEDSTSGASTLDELTDVSTSGATSGQVLRYNGSSWAPAEESDIYNLADDNTPQLGGDLDVNGNNIVSAGNGDIDFDPNGSGNVVFKGNNTRGAGAFKLNCEFNTHGITIKGPPHSANADYTLTLPNNDGNADQFLTTDGSGNLGWSSAGGGAWTLFSSTAVTSAVSQIDMSLSSSYSTYMIVVENLDPCGALYFRWKRGGTWIWFDYNYTETGTSIIQRTNQARFKIAGFDSDNHASAMIFLNNVNETGGQNPSLFSQAVETNKQMTIAGNNSDSVSGAVTDIRLYFDDNPTSGSVYIYRLQT